MTEGEVHHTRNMDENGQGEHTAVYQLPDGTEIQGTAAFGDKTLNVWRQQDRHPDRN